MDLANLTTAITARLQSDATLMALLNGIGFDVIPKTIDAPYVVMNVDTTSADDGFNTDAEWYSVKFFVVTDKRNGLGAASTILKRIHGDAMQQTNRTPTFGFHRHVLSLTVDTDYKCAGMMRTSATTSHTDEHYVFVEEYRCRIELPHSP